MRKIRMTVEHGDTLCLEFIGQYEANASWYKPLWNAIRQELGAKNPQDGSWWAQDGNTWKLLLNSKSLFFPITPAQARKAVTQAVESRNYFFNLGIELEEAAHA